METRRSVPKSPARKAKPKVAKTAPPRPSAGLETALAALREEVVSLRRDVATQTEAIARAGLDEIPRAEDFQPLADHLYTFAEMAPALLASLESARQAVGRVETVAHSLAEVADTLVATHESWTESLMRLPRAEDYEPLVGPLREFARVSPVLAETLAPVVKAVTPLPAMLEALLGTAESLRGAAHSPLSDGAARSALVEAVERMGAVRTVIREGLATLPRDKTYAMAAAHLRELATVSPSLMEWLKQLPALSMPLAESIAALEQAARELEDAERAARRLLEAEPRT